MALGNMHPFMYLFHPQNGKTWDDPVRRAGYERDLDTLINAGIMTVQAPIVSNPSFRARMEGAIVPRPWEDALVVTYWQNSLGSWASALSYALNHWYRVEATRVPRERSAGLHVAFYLLSRGADPTQVDPIVQADAAQEWNWRQAQELDPAATVRPLALPRAANGMTSQALCNAPGQAFMNYTNNDWRRVLVPLYFIAHNTNTLPAAGDIMFI